MAPTPIPNGFGIATIKYLRTGASQPYVVTWGFTDDNTISPTTIATNISGRWLTAFPASGILNDYTYVGCHVLIKRAGFLQSGDAVASSTGTVAAAAENPATAVCITKQTSLAGRAFRGRVYLPPAFISEANVSDAGIIDSATLTGLQTKANAWLTAMNGSANLLQLLHADGSPPNSITALVVRSSVRTQRRRQKLS